MGLHGILFLQVMTVLWLTAILPQAKPPYCKHGVEKCESPNSSQLAFLFSSFVLMSIGASAIRPCSLAFGADQFNEVDTLKKEKILETYNWYYVSVGVALMLAVTVMVYIQNKAGWAVGFGVPIVLMLISTLTFLLGSPLYIKAKAKSSLLTGFAQVIVAAWKNKHLAMPPQKHDDWYYHKGSELIAPTDKLRLYNYTHI